MPFLTPTDIRDLTLKRSVGGYDRAETDRLLADLVESYSKVWRERADLGDEVADLREQLAKAADTAELDELRERVVQLEADLTPYRELERRLRNALLSAEHAAERLKAEARREAELTVKKAREKAEQIVESAQEELGRLESEIRRLEAHESELRTSYRDFLRSALERLETEFGKPGAQEEARAASESAHGEQAGPGRKRAANGGRRQGLPSPLADLLDDAERLLDR